MLQPPHLSSGPAYRVRLSPSATPPEAEAARLLEQHAPSAPHTLLCMPEVLVGGSGGDGRYSAVLGSGAIFTDDAADYALGDEGALAQWLPSATVGGCATLLLRGAPCAAAGAGKKAPTSCPSGAVHGALDVLGRLGVRFWAPGVVASTAPPPRLPLPAPPLLFPWAMGAAHRTVPRFSYRELYAVSAIKHPAWAQAQHLHGGFDGGGGGGARIVFANPPGGVHTAFTLAPPSLAAAHPAWFGGQQLCWLADGLPEYLLKRARELVDDARKRAAAAGTAAPTVVSVSQADNMSPCTSGADGAATDDEGSAMAPLLRTVNFVARGLAASHPGVAVDTLAYQHTQKLPSRTRPEPNVIVRLSTIGADFSAPLAARAFKESAAFADDLAAWAAARAAQPAERRFRLLVWDYGVNFGHWLAPWPNWSSMAPNLRLYADAGVDGVFIEGNYRAKGGELAPLKSYLYAQLLWKPHADAAALTREFVGGFYGAAAAPHVLRYIAVTTAGAARAHAALGINVDVHHPALDAPTVLAALEAMGAAVAAASEAGDAAVAARVREAALAPLYVAILRWDELRAHSAATAARWPLEGERAAALARFEAAYREADMHRAWPPEAAEPDATVDAGLSEGGHGLRWLRELVDGGGGDVALSAEREVAVPHRAFGHGPYAVVPETRVRGE